ncbi:MAG: signal peptidase I [Streptomyces sp.]|nr:signal peptidase I [Streptomyces sp.]
MDGTDAELPRLPGSTRIERRQLARKVRRKRRRSLAKEVPLLILVALVIALVLKTFLVQAFVIPSGSMEQTIKIGDRVLVDKLTPWFGSQPHRGDVVVFKDPGGWLQGEPAPKPDPVVVKQVKEVFTFIGLLPASGEQDLIKRVIAVGGDTVQCCDAQGRLLVNGTPLDEPYLYPGNPPSLMTFKETVPKGRLWVMGDHRSDSADSRYHLRDPGDGTIPESLVVGRAFVIGWPIGHWQRLKEPATFGTVANPDSAATADTGAATSVASAKNGQRTGRLATPAELSLVMGVVGLRRWRSGRRSGVRSGCGGPGGRRAIWTRRAREAGCRGAPDRRVDGGCRGPRRLPDRAGVLRRLRSPGRSGRQARREPARRDAGRLRHPGDGRRRPWRAGGTGGAGGS